ncbi:unnamed protein product [Rhizophagus irregularis]|nr:unnamed protein product [Rhizophagus irregularis]
MYNCTLCKRYFSRRTDIAQHYNKNHPYFKHSYTLNWIQDQRQLDFTSILLPTVLNNDIWNDIEGFGNFSQDSSINNRTVNEDDNYANEDEDVDAGKDDDNDAGEDEDDNDADKDEDDAADEDDDNDADEDEDGAADEYEYYDADENEDGAADEHEYYDENEVKNGDNIDNNGGSYGVGLSNAYEILNSKTEPKQSLWPSETYREFMTAVTQYHLSDAAADSMLRIIRKSCTETLPSSTRKGRMYMDQMDIKNFNIKTKNLCEFEGKIYKFQYRPIFDAIKSLVSNTDLSKDFLFDYNEQWESNKNGTLVRVYSEQNTANWWRERQNPFSKILAVMIYTDGTTLDSLGKQSEYPIFLTLGNIPNWRRNFPNAKVLIGFLPHLTTRNNKLRESKEFRQMQRKLEQCALKILLEPLLQNDSIYLAINGTVEHFTPYLSTILADMLEAQNICCTYKSYHAKYPCYKCLTPGDQLNNMHIEQNSIILRTHENMREAVISHNAAEYSIHDHENFFWNFRMTNIYDAVAMDRMHLQEIGLFPYMLNFTRDMIMQQCGNKILTKMDNRLANITPFNGLKILSKGYQRGVKFTGAEMRDMYITSRKEQFSEDDLRIFEIRRQTIISIPKKIFKSKLEIMKSLLWELPISELQSLQIKLEHEKIVDDLCIEGMNHLINCLDHYLDEKSNVSESEDIYLKIYATGILSNNEIIYATSKFHGRARFSDVAIAMEDADYLTDDGICYGKVLMLAEISFLPNHPILPIVLVHWYDYYSKQHPIKYKCPHMKFVNKYDVIPFNSIVGLAHVVKRFDFENEFFVNKFIF